MNLSSEQMSQEIISVQECKGKKVEEIRNMLEEKARTLSNQ